MAVAVTAAVAASSVIPAAAESLRHLSPPGANAGTATTATVTPSLPEALAPPRPEALTGVAQRTPALRHPRGHRVPWVSLAQGSHGREGIPGLGGGGRGKVSGFPPPPHSPGSPRGWGRGGWAQLWPSPMLGRCHRGGSTAILWGTREDAAAQSPQPCPAPPGMAGGTWGQGSPRHPGTQCPPWPGGTQASTVCESLCPHAHACAASVHCTGTIEAPPPPQSPPAARGPPAPDVPPRPAGPTDGAEHGGERGTQYSHTPPHAMTCPDTP